MICLLLMRPGSCHVTTADYSGSRINSVFVEHFTHQHIAAQQRTQGSTINSQEPYNDHAGVGDFFHSHGSCCSRKMVCATWECMIFAPLTMGTWRRSQQELRHDAGGRLQTMHPWRGLHGTMLPSTAHLQPVLIWTMLERIRTSTSWRHGDIEVCSRACHPQCGASR